MKTRFQKAFLISGAMLYMLTAGYVQANGTPTSFAVADGSATQSPDGVMTPQGDPFPVCPQCTPSGGN